MATVALSATSSGLVAPKRSPLSISPAMGAHGTAVKLTGAIGPETAHEVELQLRTAGEYITLETAETTEAGRFSFTVNLPVDRHRAVYQVTSTALDPITGEEVTNVSTLADATITNRITTRVASQDSYAPAISADGRFVAFTSSSVALDQLDVYVWDRTTGSSARITDGIGGVGNPSISADGRYIAYESQRQDGENYVEDVFVWDRVTGETTLITGDNTYGLTYGDDFSAWPTISGDGRYVAYSSDATNALASDLNGGEDVFVWDRATGSTTRLTDRKKYSFGPVISADGNYIVFHTMVEGETTYDEHSSLFIWDRSTGGTTSLTGGEYSSTPAISADGQYISFTADGPESLDVFVWDRTTSTVQRITTGNQWSEASAISADGRFVTFQSDHPTCCDATGTRPPTCSCGTGSTAHRVSPTATARAASPPSRPTASTSPTYHAQPTSSQTTPTRTKTSSSGIRRRPSSSTSCLTPRGGLFAWVRQLHQLHSAAWAPLERPRAL